MYKKNIKSYRKSGGFGSSFTRSGFYFFFLAVVIVLLVVAMLKLNLGRIPKSKYINPH